MFMDIEEQLATARNIPFTRNFTKGMPVGLNLPSGIIQASL
jgi:hypothetical protein